MGRTLHLFGTDWCAMMVPIQVIRWYRMQCYEMCIRDRETWFYRLDMPEGYKHFSKTKSMKSEHCDPIREWWNDRKAVSYTHLDVYKRQVLCTLSTVDWTE